MIWAPIFDFGPQIQSLLRLFNLGTVASKYIWKPNSFLWITFWVIWAPISVGWSLFINRIIRNRVMAKTPKLKKTGFCFLIIKGSIFNIFKNGKKLHTLQLFLLNKVKIVSHKKCYLATFRYVFAFLPKKGSLIFKIQKKKTDQYNHLS